MFSMAPSVRYTTRWPEDSTLNPISIIACDHISTEYGTKRTSRPTHFVEVIISKIESCIVANLEDRGKYLRRIRIQTSRNIIV